MFRLLHTVTTYTKSHARRLLLCHTHSCEAHREGYSHFWAGDRHIRRSKLGAWSDCKITCVADQSAILILKQNR